MDASCAAARRHGARARARGGRGGSDAAPGLLGTAVRSGPAVARHLDCDRPANQPALRGLVRSSDGARPARLGHPSASSTRRHVSCAGRALLLGAEPHHRARRVCGRDGTDRPGDCRMARRVRLPLALGWASGAAADRRYERRRGHAGA